MNKFETARIWAKTKRLINVARAYRQESLVAFLHRLVVDECGRVGVDPDSFKSEKED